MSVSLFDMTAEIVTLSQAREWAEEEGDSVRVAEIDAEIKLYLQEQLPTKVDGIRGFIKAQENAEMVHKAEAELHNALAKRARANIDSVKKMCLEVMQYFGVNLYKGALHTIKRVGNGGVKPLEIRQPELVPVEYTEYRVKMNGRAYRYFLQLVANASQAIAVLESAEHGPDTAMIRAALERGEAVPGCALLDRGEHVRVS